MEYELTTWLTKDGKKIWGTEVSKKFTPNTADGEVKATLSFDATKYGGENITVFEEISLKHKLVAEHKDKDDKDQTLTVEKALENPNTPKTGDNNHMMIWLVIAVIAAVLGSGLMVCELKKKKGNTKSK